MRAPEVCIFCLHACKGSALASDWIAVDAMTVPAISAIPACVLLQSQAVLQKSGSLLLGCQHGRVPLSALVLSAERVTGCTLTTQAMACRWVTPVLLQNRAVRQVAAANLGQLVRMSPRVDQLATDLSNNARAADASIKVGGLAVRS